MKQNDIGLIGLAVMGQNLVLNMANHGFSVAVYNRTAEKTRQFLETKAPSQAIAGTETIEAFVSALSRPRRMILMVKSGQPVDDFIDQLIPHLEKGDVLVDAGNSHFPDTERRIEALKGRGIQFLGMGVSGGEEGALKGPSIMPGGPREGYTAIEPIVTTIAAQVDGEPCCTYIGPRGAGHYVKMVHNGMEYGIMQMICEVYDLLRFGLGYPSDRISEIFQSWDAGPLGGYLMEISWKILARQDDDTGQPLVEQILDTAQQKGTGKWTSQSALDLGIPIPSINAAVVARMISAAKDERVRAAGALRGPSRALPDDDGTWVDKLRDALHGSIITSYAQGMALIQAASAEYAYDLQLDEVARIWRGGCIVRSVMLEPIREAYRGDPALPNLMLNDHFTRQLNGLESHWREVVGLAARHGIPALVLGASLGYYDMYRRERLPANLLQAQRDFFGAHTYRRIDRDGVFHTQWEG